MPEQPEIWLLRKWHASLSTMRLHPCHNAEQSSSVVNQAARLPGPVHHLIWLHLVTSISMLMHAQALSALSHNNWQMVPSCPCSQVIMVHIKVSQYHQGCTHL